MNFDGRSHAKPVTASWQLKDIVAMLFRGRVVMLACLGAGLLGALIYTVVTPKMYQATASVKIDLKALQSSVLREASYISPNLSISQNEIEVLKSNSLSEIAAQKLLDVRYLDSAKNELIPLVRPSAEAAKQDSLASVREVAGRISGLMVFNPIRDSDVIKITGTSGDPREAALLANCYADAYFDRNVYASRTKSRGFRLFLETQAREKRQDLGRAEDNLRTFMEKKGVVSLDEESRRVIDQLSQLEAQYGAIDINIQGIEKTISSYREQASDQEAILSKVIGEANDPYIRQMQDQLAQLEVQRDITVAQNPAFVGKEVYNAKLNEISEQIKLLQSNLKKRTGVFLTNLAPGSDPGSGQRDPAGYLRQVKQRMLEAQIELQSLQARKRALGEAIRDYNRQFENLPRKNLDYARLQREKSSLEKLYLQVEEKYNEANIVEQGETGYIDIFDRAVAPGTPSSPKTATTFVLGILLGLGGGMLVVFGREYLHQVLRTPDDLRRHGISNVVAVVNMEQELKLLAAEGSSGSSLAPQLIMVSNPLSPVAEAYRQLRLTLSLPIHGVHAKTILVTSAGPGEGKSTTVANLAISFAQSGKKTLLFDADLRRPVIHSLFGLHLTPGVSELLQNTVQLDKAIQSTSVPNLHVITSGTVLRNPVELLSTELMKTLLQQLAQRFDVVVLDSPPVLAVADVTVLSTMTDRLVLVVSAALSTAGNLERTLEVLQGVGVAPAHTVLNNFDPRDAYGLAFKQYGYGHYGDKYAPRPAKPA